MKNARKGILSTLAFIIICSTSNAATNVSGGIYTNTRWTKANSPYHVTDTVIVFPNVTLTIDPGVTVMFDSAKYLEINNAAIIANGTATDSITFTSSALTPRPGIWGDSTHSGISLDNALATTSFNFCNVTYATDGIRTVNSISYIKNSRFVNNEFYGLGNITNTPIDSCIFSYNTYGILTGTSCKLNFCGIYNNVHGIEVLYAVTITNSTINGNKAGLGGANGYITRAYLYNCSISNNETGLFMNDSGTNVIKHCTIDYNSNYGIGFGTKGLDSVVDCEIKFNGKGVRTQVSNVTMIYCDIENNTYGILLNAQDWDIYCNKICNNTSYDLALTTSQNISIPYNYWCTTDSASIRAKIDDGYHDAVYGFVTFIPVDTIQCIAPTGIPAIEQPLAFNVFPNPANDHLTVELPLNNAKAEIQLFNVLGDLTYSLNARKQKTDIDISSLADGIYIIQLTVNNKTERQKFIKN